MLGSRLPLSAAGGRPSVCVNSAQPSDASAPSSAAGAYGSGVKAPGGKDDVSGAMLEPSPANKQWVRALVSAAAVAAAAGSSAFLPSKAAAFIHVAAFGIWLGTIMWNTFFVGLTMFKHMPRQMFGRVQSQLFPKYFGLTTGCNVVLLGSLLLLGGSSPSTNRAAITLGLALVASIGNMLFLEPVATKLMFERYALENLEEKTAEVKAQIQALYKSFGMYHGISSLINLIITGCAFAHAWFLGSIVTF